MNTQKSILAAHIAAQDYISIQRQGENWTTQCIPLKLSETLLLVLNFRDFCPDGYGIIPLRQIVSVTHSEVDAYFGKIVKLEGADALISNAPRVDLTDWGTVFRPLRETGEIVSVDIGRDGYIDVGRIMEVTDDGIEMRRFDATGVWDQENWYNAYEDLIGVELRSHYIQTFAKYLPPLEDN